MREIKLYNINELQELNKLSYEHAIKNGIKNMGGDEGSVRRYLTLDDSLFDEKGNQWWSR